MYTHFIESEYGERQRNINGGRNPSLRRFPELICSCMTKAIQRDTADQIVAVFKQCLSSWNTMRRKDRNVKASILRCASTSCSLHGVGSSTATLYSAASKTTFNFLEYVLCPKIYRDELAVHVFDSNSEHESFSSKREKQIRINIAAAEARKVMETANFNASCSRKGILHTASTLHSMHSLQLTLFTTRTPYCTLLTLFTAHCSHSSLLTLLTAHCSHSALHVLFTAHCSHSSLLTLLTAHCSHSALHALFTAHC